MARKRRLTEIRVTTTGWPESGPSFEIFSPAKKQKVDAQLWASFCSEVYPVQHPQPLPEPEPTAGAARETCFLQAGCRDVGVIGVRFRLVWLRIDCPGFRLVLVIYQCRYFWAKRTRMVGVPSFSRSNFAPSPIECFIACSKAEPR